MEAKNGGLEDAVPFQLGDFLGSMLIFGNVFICLRDPRFQRLQKGGSECSAQKFKHW